MGTNDLAKELRSPIVAGRHPLVPHLATALLAAREVPDFGLMFNNDGDLSFASSDPQEATRKLQAAIDSLGDTIPAPGDLDLSMTPDSTLMDMQGIFPTAYVSLSGESMSMQNQVVVPAFPRRSLLIDYVMELGSRSGQGPHPAAPYELTPEEEELFNLWVLLGAQYK